MFAAMFVVGTSLVLAQQNLRRLPSRDLPVPGTVSPVMQAVIGAPLSPIWNEHPKSNEEWRSFIASRATAAAAALPDLRTRLGVKVEPTTIAGVKAFVITPATIPQRIAIGCWSTSTAAATSSARENRGRGKAS